ncbi:hypothetical protein ACOQFL_05900 [Actinopolyspora sp. H202]
MISNGGGDAVCATEYLRQIYAWVHAMTVRE